MPGTKVEPRLELHRAAGAFAELERWLRDQGFFAPGGEDLVADLFLGYGLSEPLRRSGAPPPPEPCSDLPLLACAVRDQGESRAHLVTQCHEAPRVGTWERSWDEQGYETAIEAVRSAIARGDVYQVNLVQHLSASFAGDPLAIASVLHALEPLAPAPFLGEGWAVVSASPELFLAKRGRRVRTMPIKGTRPAGAARELGLSHKDAAEHVMIVDLERNDLARVCEPGSIRWPELMSTRRLAGVEHMVSTVEGVLREGVGLGDLLEATFPGGSVTGAPKIAALDLIAELEPVGRGAAMGALGRVRGNGDLELALTIRTFAIADERIHFWVGGGIVWDSVAADEVAESWTKARPVLAALDRLGE
jgi:para-aminobenzoate synthetase component I